jgi:hypothetical protein
MLNTEIFKFVDGKIGWVEAVFTGPQTYMLSTAVTRRDVLSVLQDMAYKGIAYQGTVKRDAQGDNVAASTALHVVRAGHFAEVHCAPRRQPPV